MHLADRKLQYQVDRLVLGVLGLHEPHQALGLGAVAAVLDAGVAGNLRVPLHHAQADNLVAVVDQLVDEPLERVVRVLGHVDAAEEGARALGVLVVLVLAHHAVRQDVRRAGRVQLVGEGVEGDAWVEDTGLVRY